MRDRSALTRFAWLSIGAALLTMGLKAGAYLLTLSVGLLSDALETAVNLTAAIMALVVLSIAARPPDEEHAFGHGKAEYFSSVAEGSLIVVAAGTIAVTAGLRLLHPRPIERLNLGLGIALAALLVNLAVAQILLRAGRQHRSIALEADAQHLMTDVWTSAAVLLGIGAVALTGWDILDPLIALGVAGHIAWMGFQLVRRSTSGLMDTGLPEAEVKTILNVLEAHAEQGVRYHALRTRQAGERSFISMHIQVPGGWSVQRGHNLLEAIERDIRKALPSATVFTHIEPLEDPRSWGDEHLDRQDTVNDQ
jgi:cation diffusion facilitator family transporter